MKEKTPPARFRAYFNSFFRKFPDFSIRLTRHARNRMQERDIRLPQIRSVLKSGSVSQVEQDIRTGDDKYRVVGRDRDGRMLEVVVNLIETERGRVVVVTVIDSSKSGGGHRRE